MQEYGGGVSSKTGEYRDSGPDGGRDRGMSHQADGYQPQHQYAVMQQKNYGMCLDIFVMAFLMVNFNRVSVLESR